MSDEWYDDGDDPECSCGAESHPHAESCPFYFRPLTDAEREAFVARYMPYMNPIPVRRCFCGLEEFVKGKA